MLIKLLFHRTRPQFSKEVELLTQQMKDMSFADLMDLLKGREYEAVLIDEVNKQLISTVKIKGFEQLKNTYIRDKNFSQHFCLKIASKIYFLMQNISQTSEIYKKILEEMKAVIKLKKRSSFSKELDLDQDQIVHNFISSVTSSVEIVNRENQLVVSRFLKTPSSFFLSLSSKEGFFETCEIETISQVQEGFLKKFNPFKIEMSDGLAFSKKSKYLNSFGDNGSWRVYLWTVWLLSAVQNFILLFWFDVEEEWYLPKSLRLLCG